MFKSLRQGILDLFYPHYCVSCGQKIAPGIFCLDCQIKIEPLNETPPSGFFSSVRYREPIVTAIHRFKYRGDIFLAPHLAGFLINSFYHHKFDGRVDCIIPVPLHPARFRERNFNQAGLLSREVAVHFSLPVINGCLVRVTNTPSQTGLSGRDRTANVTRAFRVRNASLVEGRRCLLVDDVLTTGATLNACRGSLFSAGADEVYGLTLARD